MEADGLKLDGLRVLPGLINAHDHLEFALFPRLGRGVYPNAAQWARDIYHPEEPPVARHLGVPKELRLVWGGIRNLLAGVTTVCHHNLYSPVLANGFPVRVVERYGWAHSLEFAGDVRAAFEATPPGAPFLIHAGEGTDAGAAAEVFRLNELGVLCERTVLIHAVGLCGDGWKLVEQAGAAVIWCPRSNLFTLGRTLKARSVRVALALGTDSPLTAEGDLLDEIAAAREIGFAPEMVTTAAESILRLPPRPEDWMAAAEFGEPPQLVVIGGRIHLIGVDLAEQLPEALRRKFQRIEIEGRPPVLIRWDVGQLLEETRRHLGRGEVRLAGREVAG